MNSIKSKNIYCTIKLWNKTFVFTCVCIICIDIRIRIRIVYLVLSNITNYDRFDDLYLQFVYKFMTLEI